MKYKWKYIMVFAGLIVLGLVCLFFSTKYDDQEFSPYLNQLAGVLVIAGGFGIIQKMITDKDFFCQIEKSFKIHESIGNAGIQSVFAEQQAFNYTELIEQSSELSILLNDGNRWVANNCVALEKRFNSKTKTIFFTLDPQCSFVNVLAEKTQIERVDLEHKIKSAWKNIEEAWRKSNGCGELKIYKISNFPTYSAFISEIQAVVTLYQCNSGRSNVPTILAGNNGYKKSFYNFVENDVRELQKKADLHFDSTTAIAKEPSSI